MIDRSGKLTCTKLPSEVVWIHLTRKRACVDPTESDVFFEAEQYSDLYTDISSNWKPFNPLHDYLSTCKKRIKKRMNKSGRKKKRDDRGSWEDEGLNEAKTLNMADNNEPSLAELKEMLTDIQTKVTNIQLENLNLKEDLIQLRAAFQSQKRDLEKLKTTLETTTKTNIALQQELQSAGKSLKEEIEEKERLSEGLDDLEQYTRKNALEIHGVPENLHSTTEEVVIKLGET